MNTTKELLIPTTFLKRESHEEYHSRKECLSSGRLRDFRKSPALYWQKICGLIEEPDTAAMFLGRGTHTYVLEGEEAYLASYAIGGPVNPKTGEVYGPRTKVFTEWAQEQGKPAVTTEQDALIRKIGDSVHDHEEARMLIALGMAEGVTRSEYHGLPMQAKLDWFNPRRGIVDFKTCDELLWFKADAKKYEYIHQMAFYSMLVWQAIGVWVPVHIIATEKKPPYATAVYHISESALDMAHEDNDAAIERLLECVKTGVYPTGYAGIGELNF